MKTETTIQTIGKRLDDMIAECEQFRREASLSDGTVVAPGEDQAYTVSHTAFYMLGRQIGQIKHIRFLLPESGLLPDKNPDGDLAQPDHSSSKIITSEELVAYLGQPDIYLARTSRIFPGENISYSLVWKTTTVEKNIEANEKLLERTYLDLGRSGRLSGLKQEQGTPGDKAYRVTEYYFLFEDEAAE